MTFVGEGRDRLCIRPEGDISRAGLIVYAPGTDANCSLQGQYAAAGATPEIQVDGGGCRVRVSGDLKREVRLGGVDPQCSYYCGPRASFAGKTFRRVDTPVPVTDLAGDPLC
jgi:hypothetical protein